MSSKNTQVDNFDKLLMNNTHNQDTLANMMYNFHLKRNTLPNMLNSRQLSCMSHNYLYMLDK